jgi:hypothetical protein
VVIAYNPFPYIEVKPTQKEEMPVVLELGM